LFYHWDTIECLPTHLLTLQSLSLTLILIFIGIYIYAVIAFLAYRDEFKLDGDNEGQSVCQLLISEKLENSVALG
jgi:hypothetical protein